jgi:hypothetical protein
MSTAKTFAPSRANKTAVAFPFPQPGPIEPAPVTIATLFFNRSAIFVPSFPGNSLAIQVPMFLNIEYL